MYSLNQYAGTGVGIPGWILFAMPFFLLIMLWSMFWKGLALWHAGRRGQPGWFMVLLVFNTIGILEIIYLFLVVRLKFSELFSKK